MKGDDLVIVGGGDPMLSAESFPAWWEFLKKSGVKRIKGRVIADPSRIESQRVPNSWPWCDVGNYYGAGASGLNFNRNLFAMTFQPGKVGEPAKLLETIPTPLGVAFEIQMRTGPRGSGDQGNVYGGSGAKVVSMRGTVPAGGPYTIYGALPDPSLSYEVGFRDFLRTKKFSVPGEVELGTVDLKGARLVHSQKSVPLEKIIRTNSFRRVNLYADSLFKALTRAGSSAMEGRVWVKPGGLTGVRTYSGYFVNKSCKEFVFAVMINNPLELSTGIVEKFLIALMLKE